MIVADTNLVAYFLLSDDRAQAASDVRARDPDWVAPPLWSSEYLNVLVTHVRVRRIDEEHVPQLWRAATELIREVPADPLAAIELAISAGLSGYDAEFVALAQALGVPLVTDDRRVLRAVPDVAISLDAFTA